MYKPIAIAMAVVSLQILFQLTLCTYVASVANIHPLHGRNYKYVRTYHPEDSVLDV